MFLGSCQYSSASVTDPQGPSSGSTRVIRGGSWGFGSSFCRASRRYSFTPNFVDEGGHGFRVARNCL
ncbi:MAG: formylglycine-generating enzyme family protein [Phycisphaerales bacterium]